jgi:hypothetical protein
MMGAARATFNTSALAVGTHTIQAVYSGDSTYPTSSTTLTQTVTSATATVSLSSSSNPSQAGQTVTFTAMVSGNSSTTPSGSVSFYDGLTLLGTATLTSMMGAARATFNTSALSVGTHTIQAVYSGDSTYPTSSATLTQTVTQATVNVNLTSSNNPSLVGQSVTFTASVTPTVMGSPAPSGSVTFKDGSTVLATVAVTNVQGQYVATFTTSALTAGAHTITASYSDPNYAPASATLTQQVNNNTIAIMASPGSSVSYGTSVTFTVTVTPASGSVAPTGTITFKVDGTTVITVTLVANGNGTSSATYTTSSLSMGSHTIEADYSGDSNYLADSTSMTEFVMMGGRGGGGPGM